MAPLAPDEFVILSLSRPAGETAASQGDSRYAYRPILHLMFDRIERTGMKVEKRRWQKYHKIQIIEYRREKTAISLLKPGEIFSTTSFR